MFFGESTTAFYCLDVCGSGESPASIAPLDWHKFRPVGATVFCYGALEVLGGPADSITGLEAHAFT